MTAAEEGLLLLCCKLGDPEIQPLTPAQYRALRARVRAHEIPEDASRELAYDDLTAIGCPPGEAVRILRLLSRRVLLTKTLAGWKARGVEVCTRCTPDYPPQLEEKLGDEAPPVLFLRGDRSLLQKPGVAVVGSRDIRPDNAAFASAVGAAAAKSGLVLISGGARGADQLAQDACRSAGGGVLSFVADRLFDQPLLPRTLYLCEDGPAFAFSASRALARNRLIHAMGQRVFVAQCTYGSGGTWRGTMQNLRARWSPVCVYDDGTEAVRALSEAGAERVSAPVL